MKFIFSINFKSSRRRVVSSISSCFQLSSISHSFASLSREISSLNTRRYILYLRAPMYYFLYVTDSFMV
jgi:hypothetical protein